jgi:F420-dependent oxidoreductase-like protein
MVSSQAQTAQAAARGRFTLGLGLGADLVSRHTFNLPNDRPAQRMREFLSALRPALHEDRVEYRGAYVTAVAPHTAVPGAQPPPPILIAAMGEHALAVAGQLAEGTITFLAAPQVIAEHIAPVITAAAAAAGRPAPRILAMVSAVVTDDVPAARAAFEAEFGLYDAMPSYQRIVALGGATGAAQLAVYGDEAEVAAALADYVAAGVDELIVSRTNLLGDAARLRTWRLLGELAAHNAAAPAATRAARTR